MAKAKPIKQKKKNKFWEGLKFLLRSLFSNNTCIDGREHKWYWPVIVGVLAACIATIPTMVGRFTTKASTFFDSYTYDLENSLTAFGNETKDVSMKINDGILTLDETAFNALAKSPDGETREGIDFWGYYYKVPVVIAQEPEKSDSDSTASSAAALVTTKDVWYCGLAVYYSGETDPYTYAKAKMASLNYDPNYILGHTDVTAYSTNMIVIGKQSMYLAKGVASASSIKSSVQVKYDSSSFNNKDLHTIVTPGENQTIIEVWKNFLDNGYSSTRVTLAWQYTGIMFAISVGIILLMGLLIFIMTRGKNNPFRIYTFWECQKIAYYASLTPALLALLGFIPMLSSMTMFLFPMTFILRTTWMSMRSLRPQQ